MCIPRIEPPRTPHRDGDALAGARSKLAVVVVSWNTRDLLLAALGAVLNDASGFSPVVYVVDNASADGSPDAVAARYPQVALIRNVGNVGFARANNQAIDATRSDYVLLLNSDTEIHPGALDRLVAFLDAHPRAAAVGPQLVYPDGRRQLSYGRFPGLGEQAALAIGLGRFVVPDEEHGAWESAPREVDYVAGACMMVRRAAITEVGLMDERFFMYSEEADWCYRLRRAGWSVWFEPAARVMHVRGGSTRQARGRMLAELYRSRVQFVRKHRGLVAARGMKLCMALDVGLRIVACPARSMLSPGPDARRDLRDRVAAYQHLLRGLPSY